jgi:hypothetical protein
LHNRICNPNYRLLYYLIVEFAHDPRYAELLAEPLTDEEVRDLLERLGSKEFGGPENATVNSVVEATGASVDTVGNLLAQIRKEDFEEKFGLKLEEHEERIESLEARTRRVSHATAKPRSHLRTEPELDHYRQMALDRLANQERQREALRPAAIVLLCFVLLFIVIAVGGECQGPPSESWTNLELGLQHGIRYETDPKGNMTVTGSDGVRRQPTEEEKAYYERYLAEPDRR